MSIELAMPKLGLTMKTGKVSKWFVAEGAMVALDDQAQGAEQVKHAAMTFAQETFDATAGAAFGALGGAATAAGAVAGGTKGAVSGSVDGVKKMADAGADVAYAATKEVTKGGNEVLRRTLRRPEDEA